MWLPTESVQYWSDIAASHTSNISVFRLHRAVLTASYSDYKQLLPTKSPCMELTQRSKVVYKCDSARGVVRLEAHPILYPLRERIE